MDDLPERMFCNLVVKVERRLEMNKGHSRHRHILAVIGGGELARAHKVSCIQIVVSIQW